MLHVLRFPQPAMDPEGEDEEEDAGEGLERRGVCFS